MTTTSTLTTIALMIKRQKHAVSKKKSVGGASGKSADLRGRATRQKTPIVRKAVLDTAAALFAERGFGGTNLRDIADELGMSRPGLYYHFPSKEKLLEAIVEEVTLSSERQIAALSEEKSDDPEAALRVIVSMTTRWVLEQHTLFKVLDRSEADLPEDLRASNEASKRAILEHFTRLIDLGIKSGRFRPIDSHVAALAISGMRNWVAWWYKPNGRLSSNEIADIIAEMAVRSLLRSDSHRARSERLDDAMRVLQEDVAHLTRLMADAERQQT